MKVTEQNYSHFVAKFKPADLDAIPARWAMAPLKVTSKKDDTKDYKLDDSQVVHVNFR